MDWPSVSFHHHRHHQATLQSNYLPPCERKRAHPHDQSSLINLWNDSLQQKLQIILLLWTHSFPLWSFGKPLSRRFDIMECSLVWPCVKEMDKEENAKKLKMLHTKTLTLNLEVVSSQVRSHRFQSRLEKYLSRGFVFANMDTLKNEESKRKNEAAMAKQKRSATTRHYYESLPQMSVENIDMLEQQLMSKEQEGLLVLVKSYAAEVVDSDRLQRGHITEWIDLGQQILQVFQKSQGSKFWNILLQNQLTATQRISKELRTLWEFVQVWIHATIYERQQLFHLAFTLDVGAAAAGAGHARAINLFELFANKCHAAYEPKTLSDLHHMRADNCVIC